MFIVKTLGCSVKKNKCDIKRGYVWISRNTKRRKKDEKTIVFVHIHDSWNMLLSSGNQLERRRWLLLSIWNVCNMHSKCVRILFPHYNYYYYFIVHRNLPINIIGSTTTNVGQIRFKITMWLTNHYTEYCI